METFELFTKHLAQQHGSRLLNIRDSSQRILVLGRLSSTGREGSPVESLGGSEAELPWEGERNPAFGVVLFFFFFFWFNKLNYKFS